MAQVKVVLDDRRALTNGEYPIKVRIYHKGLIYFSTNASTFKENWDDKVLPTDPRHKVKNARINNKLSQIEKEVLPLEMSGEIQRYNNKQLKKIIEGNTVTSVKAIGDFFIEYIETRKADRTKELYKQTLAKIEEFDPYATIDRIDVKWLTEFEHCQATKNKNSTNTISIHLRNIRAVFNYCLDNEYITNYPFRKFKIKREKTSKRSLSIDELRLFKDYPIEPHQERYRDIFMLSFYLIGINMIDLLHLKHRNVIKGRIEYRRAKTNRLYSIKIPDEAKAIIDKWKGEEYLINIMDSYKDHKNFIKLINKHLKLIGPVEIIGQGGKKKVTPLFPELSTYWARHTWATIAASLDIPKETISHALGHGNDTVTDIYIDFDLSKVDEANEKVIKHLNIS